MPTFSKTSRMRLEGVHHKLQELFYKVVSEYDCSIIYGLRSKAEQQKLYEQGLSKTMNSKHLTGHAVDVAPYPIDWNNTKRFYHFAGYVQAVAKEMGIVVRWGGAWRGGFDLNRDGEFQDLIHFELDDD